MMNQQVPNLVLLTLSILVVAFSSFPGTSGYTVATVCRKWEQRSSQRHQQYALPSKPLPLSSFKLKVFKNKDNTNKNQEQQQQQKTTSINNPFQDFVEMIQNFDDVVDDFLYKRMGNGEVFYGKRKFKPSGRPNTDGNYGGMGISDQVRIERAKAIKEERMEYMLLRRQQQQEKK